MLLKTGTVYQWLVAFAVFLDFVLIDGMRFSFGVLFIDLVQAFHSGKGSTAWIGATVYGVYNLSGIISGIVVRKLGCAATTCLGSLISATGLFISSFATSLTQLYFTYGVFLGFGFSLMSLSGVVIITNQFDNRRSLAMGIAMCGGGFGEFLFNPLVRNLLDNYGWRGTLFLLSGINLNGLVIGCIAHLVTQHRTKMKNTTNVAEVTKPMLSKTSQNELNEENMVDVTTENDSTKNDLLPVRNNDSGDETIAYSLKDKGETDGSTCKTILNCIKCVFPTNVLRNKHAILFLLGALIRSFPFFIPLTYLPDLVVGRGFSTQQGAWVASIAGITNCIWRPVIGAFADLRCIDRLLLFASCVVLSGVLTSISFLYTSLPLVTTYAVLFAMTFSGEVALTPVIAADVSSVEEVSDTLGLLMTVCGVGALFGTPVAGWLFDLTQSYDASYGIAGGMIVISGLVLYPIKCISPNKRPDKMEIVIPNQDSDTQNIDVVLKSVTDSEFRLNEMKT